MTDYEVCFDIQTYDMSYDLNFTWSCPLYYHRHKMWQILIKVSGSWSLSFSDLICVECFPPLSDDLHAGFFHSTWYISSFWNLTQNLSKWPSSSWMLFFFSRYICMQNYMILTVSVWDTSSYMTRSQWTMKCRSLWTNSWWMPN